MTMLCPFYNDICKGNHCIMWHNENCLIVNFLKRIQMVFPEENEIPADQIEYPYEVERVTVPNYIKSISPEELAVEYIEFMNQEFPDSDRRPYNMFDIFLESKGVISRYGLPSELRLKIHKARALADSELSRSRKVEHDIRLEQERAQLNSLVDRYLDWVEAKGLNKIRLADVGRFVRENELDLLKETERDIYDRAQIRLEEKNREKIMIEREELPSLVDQCVDWARANGLRSVTKADIETFLLENNLDIMKETKRSLYAMTNTNLKTKR